VEWTSSLSVYGTDAQKIWALGKEHPHWKEKLHPRLPYIQAEVIWATRFELARTIEDVLARRTRALFLDASASIEAAPVVARLMASELKKDQSWEKEQVLSFGKVAALYNGLAT